MAEVAAALVIGAASQMRARGDARRGAKRQEILARERFQRQQRAETIATSQTVSEKMAQEAEAYGQRKKKPDAAAILAAARSRPTNPTFLSSPLAQANQPGLIGTTKYLG